MTLIVSCPHCDTSFQVGERFLGRTARCRVCLSPFHLKRPPERTNAIVFQPTAQTPAAKSVATVEATEFMWAQQVARQAKLSLTLSVVSLVCFGAVLGPMAVFAGWRALGTIDEHDVGHEHKSLAVAGMVIGILSVVGLLGMALVLGHAT